jgi:D-arabinose 1-dehydrogenase-like Zn-dependent alcohol dehydrogenase
VGVGCMVDSCMDCRYCKRGDEQFCATGSTFTYGGVSTYGRCGPPGKPTIGGYRCVAHCLPLVRQQATSAPTTFTYG